MTLTIPIDQPGKHFGHIRLPYSRDDSAWGHLMVPACVLNHGSGPTALVTGANHGDEYEGPTAIRRFLSTTDASAITGRIIAIPSLNHPAFQAGRRTSPLDGGNLNRAFPGDPSGTPTQKIAAFLNDHLIPVADLVLDFDIPHSFVLFRFVIIGKCGWESTALHRIVGLQHNIVLAWFEVTLISHIRI